jgi:hypothetical protein
MPARSLQHLALCLFCAASFLYGAHHHLLESAVLFVLCAIIIILEHAFQSTFSLQYRQTIAARAHCAAEHLGQLFSSGRSRLQPILARTE